MSVNTVVVFPQSGEETQDLNKYIKVEYLLNIDFIDLILILT